MALVATSLNTVTANSTGTTISYDELKTAFTVQVDYTGFTNGNIILQGSLNGTQFHNISGTDLGSLSGGGFFRLPSEGAGYLYARVNLVNADGSGTLTAIVAAA